MKTQLHDSERSHSFLLELQVVNDICRNSFYFEIKIVSQEREINTPKWKIESGKKEIDSWIHQLMLFTSKNLD